MIKPILEESLQLSKVYQLANCLSPHIKALQLHSAHK